jgi:hypothetical protein
MAMLYQPVDRLRIGITGRDLNTPRFEWNAPEGKYKLRPQVRAGAAYNILPPRPAPSMRPIWIVAADIDVTENKSDALAGFKSRLVSGGTEIKFPLWIFGLAVRAGLYDNLSSDTNSLTYTAGLGIRVWKLELDVAGGMSSKKTQLESATNATAIPNRADVSGTLAWNQQF